MIRSFLLFAAGIPALVLSANNPPPDAAGHEGHGHEANTVRFVKNEGQWQAPFLYRADANGATAFMESDGVTWVKLQEDAFNVMHDAAQLTLEQRAAIRFNGHAWRVRFDAPPVSAEVEERERASFYHNYFLGNDPGLWRGHVPVFGEVAYPQVWPGIDVVFRSAEGNLKYDVLLAPDANAARIGLLFSGLDGMLVNAEGNLVMSTSVGEVTELAPVAFYSDGSNEAIPCSFVVRGDRLGFELDPGYDRSRPVTIDPVLIASTLSGCTGASNYGHCATYDDAGNLYTGARNFGPTYPATLGAFQTAFGGGGTDNSHSKYNPDGSNLIWASYLGGSAGENPHSMIVNTQGQLCVMGSTASLNYPTTAGAYDVSHNGGGNDMTITVFAADGSALVGSTYLGGSGDDGTNNMWGNYGEAYRGEIYLDANDNVLVAGFTSSANFPTTAGAIQTAFGGGQDGVVLSVNNNCSSLLWSTFMGGIGDDGAFGLRLSNGSLFVCGSTESANFTSTPGAFQTTPIGGRDGWVAKMSTTGTVLQASTFYGTIDDDRPYFLDTDNNGDVWIYGQSDGAIPIQPAGTYGNVGGSIFVAKFTSDLATVPVSTMMGGSTVPVAFLVDHCDHIYLSGFSSTGLPTTPNFLYANGSFWLAAFDVDMIGILFGTYYGGSHVDGGTSRFDKDGIIYQGVCSGMGSLQTTAWAWATNQTVGWDIGVFKIDFQVAGVNAAGASNLNTGCAPIVIDFSNTSTGTNWVWDFGDGSPLDITYEPSHLYTTAGVYTVTLIAFDSLSCNLADTITFPITIGLSQPINAFFLWGTGPDCTVPQIATNNLSTGSPLSFIWDMGDGTFYTDTNVVHTYATPGFYFVELVVYDPTGCSQPDSVTTLVNILPPLVVVADFTYTTTPGCNGVAISTTNLSTGPAPDSQWDMGDGNVFISPFIPYYLYTAPGAYTLTLIVNDPIACNVSDTLSVIIQVDSLQPMNAAFTVAQAPGCNVYVATTTNTSSGSNISYAWDMGDGTLYTDSNVVHTYLLSGTYTIQLIVSDSLGCNPPDTATAQVIFAPPAPVLADFTVAQVIDCSLNSVQTTNLSIGVNMAFAWDMGDGTTYGNVTDVLHNYATQGSYNIQLIVIDLNGCVPNDTLVVPITIAPPLIVNAGFTVTQDPDCNELKVDCINTSVGPSPSYQWDMGDGTVYTSLDVVDHIYAVPGTYTITLIATDPLACNQADTVSIDVTLLPYAPVVAAFTAAQVLDCAQLLLDATNTSTGSFMSFAWDMGDGTFYTDTSVTHNYLAPGMYVITMVVSDLAGCAPSDTATLSVTVDPLVPVTADFIADQVGNCTFLTVQATNQSTGDSIAYSWDMGDGTTYTTTDVTHVYGTPGTYTIELVVTDLGCGNDDSLSITVTVIDVLPVVAATTGVICPGLTTDIDATGTPGSTYLWNDGSTDPVMTVDVGGTYIVTVTYDNCTGTDTIDVVEAPAQDLSYGFDACPGSPITLAVPFQGSAYLWESTGGTEQSEYLLFPGTDTTDYDFQVWDSYGCVHEDSVTVTPMDSQPQLFAPNAFTPDGDGINDEFVITGYGEREVELLIFNRWGEQIFNTTSLSNKWNGTYNGQIKQDVYVYKLKYNGECTNDETSIMGHVTVVK